MALVNLTKVCRKKMKSKNKTNFKKFGLTYTDLLVSQNKIDSQRDYLEKNELITKNGQLKSLLDLSYSANHSERYYAQLANKINTMEMIALNKGLTSYFLTMTLDGFYRDLINGDYSRYNAFKAHKKLLIKRSVPNNEKLGFIQNKLDTEQKLTIKDLYNILNHQMRQFRNKSAFKKLKENNDDYVYIRTVEPHENGVPHFHMMLFIPKKYESLFKKDFKSSFVAPQNTKPLRDNYKKPIDGTMIGFQSDINDASAYIMKYITKSFMDVKNDAKLDFLSAWYVKHKIFRCVTSRSVVPQWIFQKISMYEKDWYYLSDILDSPRNESEWSKEKDYFYLYDNWSNKEIAYEYGRLSVYSSNILVFRAGEVNHHDKKIKQYEKKIGRASCRERV